MLKSRLNIGILISGRGSNMVSLVKAANAPDFPATIKVIGSNTPDALGLNFAQEVGISHFIVDHRDYPKNKQAFEEALRQQLDLYGPIDLLVLAGFMRLLSEDFIEKFNYKIINIHPSLLPDYKGLNTHERALKDGRREHGCTVHWVTAAMDEGEIILQKKVPVLDNDTVESLSQRVLEAEHLAYPEALKKVCLDLLK